MASASVSAATADRIQRADLHFDRGRRLYFQGDLSGARHEFDASVDVLLSAPEAVSPDAAANLNDKRRVEKRLDELCDLIYRFDVEKLGSGAQPEEAENFDRAPIDEVSHTTFPVDSSIATKLRGELNQTASAIPLELSDPVLSYVHFFSTERGRSILIAGLKRSGRYRAMIERVFAEEQVPQELIYLAQAESGFLARAVSNKQAVGMWQFIAGTGSRYDLQRTSDIDERMDPEKATRAAARHLKDLYARYGDWYLAMAAYNCGAGNVDRAVERTGYADYWELLKRRALPRETASYVPIIVAITIMAKNPQDYGLTDLTVDEPVEFETVQLSASTSLNLIADASMQPISIIRDLNPEFLRPAVPSGFSVRVPKGSASAAVAALEKVPAENRCAWRLHHVESGDTLATIAQTYHLTASRLQSVNDLSDGIDRGDVLLIPAVLPKEKPARVRAVHGHTLRPASRSIHIAAARRLPSGVITHRTAFVRRSS